MKADLEEADLCLSVHPLTGACGSADAVTWHVCQLGDVGEL